jgi:Zn-dependent metalloprotease
MALYFIAPTADTPAHFLDDTVHRSIPAGAVKITSRVFQSMLAARSEGREILADPDGKPKAGPKPVESIADLRGRQIQVVKSEAARRIAIVAPIWKQINDTVLLASAAIDAEKAAAVARRATIDAIRSASDALEAMISVMNNKQLAVLDVAADRFWPAAQA